MELTLPEAGTVDQKKKKFQFSRVVLRVQNKPEEAQIFGDSFLKATCSVEQLVYFLAIYKANPTPMKDYSFKYIRREYVVITQKWKFLAGARY